LTHCFKGNGLRSLLKKCHRISYFSLNFINNDENIKKTKIHQYFIYVLEFETIHLRWINLSRNPIWFKITYLLIKIKCHWMTVSILFQPLAVSKLNKFMFTKYWYDFLLFIFCLIFKLFSEKMNNAVILFKWFRVYIRYSKQKIWI